MAKRPRTPDDHDSPWKEALHLYFPSFLAFFFADIHGDIDWPRGYESLDKEFQQIVRRARLGKRLADKLFKVWLKDGTDCWILIHVEIQAEAEKEFPRRMFEYHIAIRRLYNREIAGLALLCDDQPAWKPTRFAYERWACRMELTFRVAKMLVWLVEGELLENSDNPIATVVLAHLAAMETRGDPADRKTRKLRRTKGLLRRNWSADDIRELYRLIDWLMTLPEDFHEEFLTEIHNFEEEKTVAFMTDTERYGMKKGLAKGLRKGRLEGSALLMDVRFGPTGRGLLRKARTLDVDELGKFTRFLKKAQTLDEVREYLK